MVFEAKFVKDEFVDKIYEKTLEKLNNFFEFKWMVNKPQIFVLPDRKTIDIFQLDKTPDWLVAFAYGTNVFILDRKNYEKESCHKYSDDLYEILIIHELVHLFANRWTRGNLNPQWVNEGIAIYLSGKNKFNKNFKYFTNFLDCFYSDKLNSKVYEESGFAVQVLIEKYGKKLFLDLLKTFPKIKTQEDFNGFFEELYGFEPSYEKFNELL